MSNEIRSLVCVREEVSGFKEAGNTLGVEVVGHCSGKLVMP